MLFVHMYMMYTTAARVCRQVGCHPMYLPTIDDNAHDAIQCLTILLLGKNFEIVIVHIIGPVGIVQISRRAC